MAKTSKTNQEMPTKTSRMHDYREHLKIITNGLMEMASKAGRTEYTKNQLLRECYNLVDAELHTFEGWKAKGATIRKGQHAYLFWGAPVQTAKGYSYCPVVFQFAKEQVQFNAE